MFPDPERVTPFSRINLDPSYSRDFSESLNTMDVELEEAVLVVRGKHQGKEIEFQVGSLNTRGDRNGMVLIHTAEYHDLRSGYGLVKTIMGQEEYRLLLDCELEPDRNGHAYTIRMRDGDS